MGFKYQIYPEKGLLVDKLNGEISFARLKDCFLRMTDDELFPLVKKVISDISEASFKVRISDLDEFVSIINKPNIHEDFKWAVLSTKPLPTALTYLISITPQFRNKLGIFSTLDNCSSFVGIEYSRDDINGEGFIEL